MSEDDYLPSPRQIVAAHEEIENAQKLKFTGARVASPRLAFRDLLSEVRAYDEVYVRAGCLLRKVVTAHLFEDGNKRTAWAVTRQYLAEHDLKPAERRPAVVAHVLRSIRRYDVEEIAAWLETGDIDRSRLTP